MKKKITIAVLTAAAVFCVLLCFFKIKESRSLQNEVYIAEMHIDLNSIRYVYHYSSETHLDPGATGVTEWVLFPGTIDEETPGVTSILRCRSDDTHEKLPAELEKELLISRASESSDGMQEYICFTLTDNYYKKHYLSLDDNQTLKDGLYAYFMRNLHDKDRIFGQPCVPEKLPEIYSSAQLSGERDYIWHIYTRIDENENLFWGGSTQFESWLERAVFASQYYSSYTAVTENNCAAQLAALIDELIAEDSSSLFFDKCSVDYTLHTNVDIGETVILVEDMLNDDGKNCTLRIKLDTEKTRAMAGWLMHTVDYYICLAENEVFSG